MFQVPYIQVLEAQVWIKS